MINFNQLKIFLEPSMQVQSLDKQVKYVLRLKNRELSVVPIEETKLFERIQAWFGFGSLNLSNIVNFLSQEVEQFQNNEGLTRQEKEDFFNQISRLTHSYNEHHIISKVSPLALGVINGFQRACYRKDATYNTQANQGRGIIDVSYADGKRGFGYVADGTGHNNELMAPVLNRIFSNFNREYALAFDVFMKTSFHSSNDYETFINDHVKRLGDNIHNEPEKVLDDLARPDMTHLNDGTLKPAFSFAQLAKINDQHMLFSCQYSDTMILIKKADGNFDDSLSSSRKRGDRGLGDIYQTNPINITSVEPKDTVYGFSDGIGEFLTMEELKECIRNNENPDTLLSELKEKITTKGKNPPEKNIDRPDCANGKRLKYHNWDDSKNYDDISMFSLTV